MGGGVLFPPFRNRNAGNVFSFDGREARRLGARVGFGGWVVRRPKADTPPRGGFGHFTGGGVFDTPQYGPSEF